MVRSIMHVLIVFFLYMAFEMAEEYLTLFTLSLHAHLTISNFRNDIIFGPLVINIIAALFSYLTFYRRAPLTKKTITIGLIVFFVLQAVMVIRFIYVVNVKFLHIHS